MKIGFLGFSNSTNKLINKLFKQNGISISGYYTTSNKVAQQQIKKFQSISELIQNSDIIYVLGDDFAFQAGKLAIKESRHLFFDSPFLLPKKEFDELFRLSNETNCLIKFNQEILQKQIYQQIKKKLDPSILKIHITFNTIRNQKKLIQKSLFDSVSIARDNIQSGIRKTFFYSIPGDNETPLTFSYNVIFDNGKTMEILFTQVTNEEKFTVHSYQKTEVLNIDFNKNVATITGIKGKEVETRELKKVNNHDKTAKDLRLFATELENHPYKPLIVREENQLLLTMVNEIVTTVFQQG